MNSSFYGAYADRNEYMRNYFQQNKAKCKLSQMKWREKNREYVREYQKEYMKNYRKIPSKYKGRKGIVKLEKKTKEGLKFIHQTVIITF